jgi:RNA polymerase sigma factor (sigma-70 family)
MNAMSLLLNLPDATPAELLREFVRAKCGESFAELVRRYAGLVIGTAVRVTGSREAAEDVAQEVFALLARKASAVEAASLGGWLHRVAVRRATAARQRTDARARRDRAALMNTELLSESPSDPQWAEILPALDRALDSLPAEDRAVVVLRYYEQLSFHEIAARLPLTAEAARKRTTRAIERLGRTLKARGLSTTAAALAAGLAAQWKAEAALVSPNLAARALTKAGVLPAGVVLTTTLATMTASRWVGAGAIAACLTAGAIALPSLLRAFKSDLPDKKPGSVVAALAAEPSAKTAPAPRELEAPIPVTEDALLATLKIDLKSVSYVEDLKSLYKNGKPVREEAFTLGEAPAKDGKGMARLYLRWWPEDERYCFSYGGFNSEGYYGPFSGSPLTNHDLRPYLLARLEGREPRFLDTNSAFSAVQSFVRSKDVALRRFGWEIFAALEKPVLSTANQMTLFLPGNAAEQLKEDAASPDPAMRALVARVHKKIAEARAFYDSCKEELPVESYQAAAGGDEASFAGLPWGPAENGVRFALIVPEKVKQGEPFPLSWAVQNTGSEPVRLLYMDDGSPWLKWNGPDGKDLSASLNPNLNHSFHVERHPKRRLLQPGECLRVALSTPVTVVEKPGPRSVRELHADRGPLTIKATLYLPGSQSYDDAKQKVLMPAKGEYEGILDSEVTVEVE